MRRIVGVIVVAVLAATVLAAPAQSAGTPSATVRFSVVGHTKADMDADAMRILSSLDPSATWTVTYTEIRPSRSHGPGGNYSVTLWAGDVEATT